MIFTPTPAVRLRAVGVETGQLASSYRLWDATLELCRQRGDTCASDWAAEQVRELIREEVEDPGRVEMLAEAMEAYLSVDQKGDT